MLQLQKDDIIYLVFSHFHCIVTKQNREIERVDIYTILIQFGRTLKTFPQPWPTKSETVNIAVMPFVSTNFRQSYSLSSILSQHKIDKPFVSLNLLSYTHLDI